MDVFGLDLGEVFKLFGGLIAFSLVLYMGVLFYKKEGSFSAEYVMLLEQYKSVNEDLREEVIKNQIHIHSLEKQVNDLEKRVTKNHSTDYHRQ